MVDAGVYDLLGNYGDNFNGKGENCVESVFEIQFTANRTGGVDERHPFNWEISPSALDGWQLFLPSDWLMDEMMADKTEGGAYSDRVYQSVFFDDPASEMRPPTETYYVPYADIKDNLTFPYYFKKYSEWEDRDGSYVGTNISIIRFADVLLMHADNSDKYYIGISISKMREMTRKTFPSSTAWGRLYAKEVMAAAV